MIINDKNLSLKVRHIVFKTKTCGIHYNRCNPIGARKWSHAYLGGVNLDRTIQCVDKSTWAMSNTQLFNWKSFIYPPKINIFEKFQLYLVLTRP